MAAVSEAAKAKQRAYRLRWAKENREKRRETERRYAASHPEAVQAKQKRARPRIRAYMKAKRDADPAAANARFREWYRKNTEYNAARKKVWNRANPDAVSVHANRRRANKMSALGEGVSREQWEGEVLANAGLCTYCGERKKLVMDHIDPLSRGGEHDISNVTPACKHCNSSKLASSLLLWLARRAGEKRRVRTWPS